MLQPNPLGNSYDYGLGIDSDIIDYIKEDHQIQIRISPVRCYVLFQNRSGSVVASSTSPITVNSYIDINPYTAQIWPSGSLLCPDIRPDTNNGQGSINVYIDNTQATRIVNYTDIINDNEFSINKRLDREDQRVELIFNQGFNASSHNITYYYTSIDQDITTESFKSGESPSGSIFGYTQYLSHKKDHFQNYNQILVRMPLTTEGVVINEEGLVAMKENQCWTLWEPYLNNFDILIVPHWDSPINQELRFQVIDKQDSKIQGELVSQKFRVKLLTTTDKIYNIPYQVGKV